MILDVPSSFANTATDRELDDASIENAERTGAIKTHVHSIIGNASQADDSLWSNPFSLASEKKDRSIFNPLWSNSLLLAPISTLILTSRSSRSLKLENIQCIGELIQCSDADILSFANLGAWSLKEIKAALKLHGFMLGTKLEHWYLPDLLLPVESLELPIPIVRNLKLMDIHYVGDLVTHRDQEDFQKIHFDIFSQIFHVLSKKGLHLWKTVRNWPPVFLKRPI